MANSTKKWTIMVYLAGDNNLDENGAIDLEEMKKAGSTKDVNVIAQLDRAGDDLPTNRYYVQKGTSPEEDVVQSLGEVNTGDPDRLIEFIDWGAKNYPADHYMLVLWNHGRGWDDTDVYAEERGRGMRLVRPSRIRNAFFKTSVKKAAKMSAESPGKARAILYDDNAKDFVDNQEFKKVVEAAEGIIGHKLDVLGMDACLMSMAEVLYQLRDNVSYTVGSEETEPGDGWPYDAILSALNKKPAMTPAALSKLVVQKYVASYKDTANEVTQSACDLAKSPKFKDAFTAFAAAMKDGLSDAKALEAITYARSQVQSYYIPDNVDLVDYCELLTKRPSSKKIKDACGKVIAATKGTKGMVVSSSCCGATMQNSHGLAIYFPTREIDLSPLYGGLDFAETGWNDFLKGYVAARLRRP